MTDVFGHAEDDVSRRNVRHALMRAHNARVRELRDDRHPLAIYACLLTIEELELDGDPAEANTLDSLGRRFLGIPLLVDPRLAPGQFTLLWPDHPQVPAGAVRGPEALFDASTGGRP